MKRLLSILTIVMIGGLTLILVGCSSSSSSSTPAESSSPAESPTPVDKLAITANADDNTISILSTNSLSKIGDDIPLSGEWPWEIALSVDGATAYVICRDSNSISIIDMAGATETGAIPLTGTNPSKAVIAGDGFLYVAYRGDSGDSPFLSKVDIAAETPDETEQIALTGTEYSSIAVTPDGLFLYVGGYSSAGLSKVDVTTGTETVHRVDVPGYIYDIEITDDGLAYMATYNQEEIRCWDTNTDTWTTPLGVGQYYEWMEDVALDGDMLIGTYYADGDNGGIVLTDTTTDWADYDFSQDDDDEYTVNLPFTFTFDGTGYDSVSFNSNGAVSFDGYVEYEQDIVNITGFSPNNEDLDSGDGYLFNYSSRTFADHAVFQWSTSMNDDELNPSYVSIFEVVLFADGTARFDYLFSMPDAYLEDDEYSYGVGDGSEALVDMRDMFGSPYDFERQSFLWDPATPNTMTEVPFQWEGTGVLHLPVTGHPHGIALTSEYAFIPLSKDYDTGDASTTVQVYDLETMLPAGTITVGAGPRAIAIQP